jgi:hypothetical protein
VHSKGIAKVLKHPRWALCAVFISSALFAQEASRTTKPTEHILGTVTAANPTTHTITVKDDKTGSEQTVLVGNTQTILKVLPGAKDLKNAVRITAEDLQAGDRVDVRGVKAEDDPNEINARSVVLMSGRDIQKLHQAEAAAWAHSISGRVVSVDPGTGKLSIVERSGAGTSGSAPVAPQLVTVDTSSGTQFTRYSPTNPQVPVASNIAEIQPSDQVRVVGTPTPDGSTIDAQKIYSGAFRSTDGTVMSIASDGKSITVRDLNTKKPIEVKLTDAAKIRKLPPQMAMMLARRLNPSYRGAPPSGEAGAPASGAKAGEGTNAPGGNPAWQRHDSASPSSEQGAGPSMHGRADVSQMIENLPAINVSELKPGDAVVIFGVAPGRDSDQLIASNVIAGVEPVLQSAPASRRGNQSAGGDWGLGEMEIPQ